MESVQHHPALTDTAPQGAFIMPFRVDFRVDFFYTDAFLGSFACILVLILVFDFCLNSGRNKKNIELSVFLVFVIS